VKTSGKAFSAIGRALVILAIAAIYIVPFYWMLLTSIKSQGDVLVFPPTFWVAQPRWENFGEALSAFPFLRYLLNSVIVSVAIILCQCLTVIPAAYAFARFSFKGQKALFAIALASMMIPAQLVFLPVFLMESRLGMINSYASLILPSATSAFGIFMLRQTFKQVPEEVIEAARLDKTSEFKIMIKIMLPIAKPTIATLALFTFISTWNDYFWPLVLTTDDRVRTLPLGVASLKMAENGIAYHTMMAGNLIIIIPILIVFLFAQRQVVKAFTYMGKK
jgi:sn-glycerol 3-phosphate transport system permease protein